MKEVIRDLTVKIPQDRPVPKQVVTIGESSLEPSDFVVILGQDDDAQRTQVLVQGMLSSANVPALCEAFVSTLMDINMAHLNNRKEPALALTGLAVLGMQDQIAKMMKEEEENDD